MAVEGGKTRVFGPVEVQEAKHVGIGGGVWASASLVVDFARESGARLAGAVATSASFPLAGLRVLELGSGTGCAGLGWAALGADVVVTDTAEHVPLMEANVARNVARGAVRSWTADPADAVAGPGRVLVAELDWFVTASESPATTAARLESWGPIDVILGSDLVYNVSLHAGLLATLDRILDVERARRRVVADARLPWSPSPRPFVLLGHEARGLGSGAFFSRLESEGRGWRFHKIPDRDLPLAWRAGASAATRGSCALFVLRREGAGE